MRPVEKVLEVVDRYEERHNGFWRICPVHDDHDPSLHVEEGEDGHALVICRAGCDQERVLDALEERGAARNELFPGGGSVLHIRDGRSKSAEKAHNGREHLAASWSIKHASGRLVAIHERWEGASGKRFLWKHPNSRYSRNGEIKASTLPLYGTEHVKNWPPGAPAILAEGEKARDALAAAHLPGLGTVTGASGTPGPKSLEVLRGRKVILWPDADDEGLRHMQRIAERLQSIASEVRIFEWRDAPPKGDAAEHPAVLSRSRQSVRALLEQMASTLVWESGSSSSSSLTYRGNDDDDANLGLLWFSEMGEPKPREFLVEDLLPKDYPATIYGTGGVAKSMLALLMGISYAGGLDRWLGLQVNAEGAVLYFDFELDADEQLRRVRDLCAGLGVKVPEKLGYLSALGKASETAFEAALRICQRHDVRLLILDILGPAMIGDAEKARDVIAFHNKFIAPFRAMGVTTLIVDHQGKVQSGEQYQGKTALGSAYKGHLVRSGIQVEAVRREKEAGPLTVRLRQNKTNFGGQRDPFDVLPTFRQGKITAEPVEVDATELASEATLNADDRVLLALDVGAAFPDELAEIRALNDRGDDTPEGELTDGILDQLAKFERAKTAERTRRGKLRKAREGKVIPTHTADYGFKFNDARTGNELDEDHMPIVRRIFRLVGVEGKAMHHVKKRFDGEGIRPPKGGQYWSKQFIRSRILDDVDRPHTYDELKQLVSSDVAAQLDSNKCYGVWWFNVRRITTRQVAEAGSDERRYRRHTTTVIKPKEEWIAVPVPDAGIPREWVNAARAAIAHNRAPSLAGNRFWELSAGVFYCGECGRRMSPTTVNAARGHLYYRCPTRQNDGKDACPLSKNFRANEVESLIWGFVSNLLSCPESLQKGLETMLEHDRNGFRGDPELEAKVWLEKLADAERKRSSFQDMAAEGLITFGELRTKLAALRENV